MESKKYIIKTVIHAGTKAINFVPGTKVHIFTLLF